MNLARTLLAAIAIAALAAVDGSALAQPKDKHKDNKEAKEQKDHGNAGAKEKKAKHQHKNGKALLGDRIKTNGKHKLEQHGKHTAYANTRDGKIAGVVVESADGGKVPVKKYKTSKKMAASAGVQPVSLQLAQAQYMGSTWIGYAYIDEWGDEVIYWYEYDMVYDGDTGAVEYIPVY
jgi:hypothetical protein